LCGGKTGGGTCPTGCLQIPAVGYIYGILQTSAFDV